MMLSFIYLCMNIIVTFDDFSEIINKRKNEIKQFFNKKNNTEELESNILNYTLKLKKTDKELFFKRAEFYFLLKKYDRALSDYNEVIKLDKNYSEASYKRGWCNYYLKNFYDAFNDWINDKTIKNILYSIFIILYYYVIIFFFPYLIYFIIYFLFKSKIIVFLLSLFLVTLWFYTYNIFKAINPYIIMISVIISTFISDNNRKKNDRIFKESI